MFGRGNTTVFRQHVSRSHRFYFLKITELSSKLRNVHTDFLVITEYIDRFHNHDDVIKWKHFPRYWPFVRGIHRSPVNSPHKGQWRGALMFSLISARINGWVNNREAGDLRRIRPHYDVTVMYRQKYLTYLMKINQFYTIFVNNPIPDCFDIAMMTVVTVIWIYNFVSMHIILLKWYFFHHIIPLYSTLVFRMTVLLWSVISNTILDFEQIISNKHLNTIDMMERVVGCGQYKSCEYLGIKPEVCVSVAGKFMYATLLDHSTNMVPSIDK